MVVEARTGRPYSGRTRTEWDADRRERLLTAALELFGPATTCAP